MQYSYNMKRFCCVICTLIMLLWVSQMKAQQTMNGVFTGKMEAQGTEIELIFEFVYDTTENM